MNETQRLWCDYGGRFTEEQRAKARKLGLYCYSMRDREGVKYSIEKHVLINHIGDLITNFPIKEVRGKKNIIDGDEFHSKYSPKYCGDLLDKVGVK